MKDPVSIFSGEEPQAARLLQKAHELVLTFGYQAMTMDQLAHELGVSKKTLYVHFPSKDAIVERIIERIAHTLQSRFERVLGDRELTFVAKIRAVSDVLGDTLTNISPALLRDLQRFAPAIYQKIEDVRQRVIPVVFGRLIREGIAQGMVRKEVDPAFAAEFWLHAIRGLVQPASLQRTGRTLPQTFSEALELFFAGLLTPAGRKHYEKHG